MSLKGLIINNELFTMRCFFIMKLIVPPSAVSSQVILNADFMDKKRVDVAVRDQKSVSGRVWARMVHSVPTRETPALGADAEAAARLV